MVKSRASASLWMWREAWLPGPPLTITRHRCRLYESSAATWSWVYSLNMGMSLVSHVARPVTGDHILVRLIPISNGSGTSIWPCRRRTQHDLIFRCNILSLYCVLPKWRCLKTLDSVNESKYLLMDSLFWVRMCIYIYISLSLSLALSLPLSSAPWLLFLLYLLFLWFYFNIFMLGIPLFCIFVSRTGLVEFLDFMDFMDDFWTAWTAWNSKPRGLLRSWFCRTVLWYFDYQD